jgi:hypothetical protein
LIREGREALDDRTERWKSNDKSDARESGRPPSPAVKDHELGSFTPTR